jgi:hypothetical protein
MREAIQIDVMPLNGRLSAPVVESVVVVPEARDNTHASDDDALARVLLGVRSCTNQQQNSCTANAGPIWHAGALAARERRVSSASDRCRVRSAPTPRRSPLARRNANRRADMTAVPRVIPRLVSACALAA